MLQVDHYTSYLGYYVRRRPPKIQQYFGHFYQTCNLDLQLTLQDRPSPIYRLFRDQYRILPSAQLGARIGLPCLNESSGPFALLIKISAYVQQLASTFATS